MMTSAHMFITEGSFTTRDLSESATATSRAIEVPTELLNEWRAARQAFKEAEDRLKAAIGEETLETLDWL